MEYHASGSLPLLGRPRYCPGANANGGYLCETGHCCGESGCCTYYYELWWFWLLWTVLILFSCCCAYRHRRAKLRVQQQQRQRDISLLAYQGASSFPSSMLDLSFLASLKLPSYEEVAAQPSTPPPPYSSVFTAPRYPQPPRTADPHLLTQHPGAQLHRALQPMSDGPSSLSSDNSSSCSCDSCCPSSPCSSSLSAPVTYETDTSHTSTPSEATPLTLDSVTMETISAAASRLELPRDKLDNSAPVAILIEETNPVAATEIVTVVPAGSASPSETIASPNSDSTFPVGITPIKQQLDIKPIITNPTSSSQSTENSKSSSPTTSPPASLNLPRTFDSTTSHKQPRTLNLILDSNEITIRADPPSFAASPSSPCSIPSPPVSMLLLDPLAALHPSEKSGASSGHASSLSPSPRNTQSPPKQTLFSPCVDVFEPVNANWDDEESEEQADEEYCEDSDVAADESQYRHRRLTGDSGIEVCRCRVEDEDDDDDEDDEKEELEKDGGKDGGDKKLFVGSSELHDSVDCPVRSQKNGSTGEDIDLCNTEATQGSDKNVVISVETV
ncbi:hypothetical protein WMY93_014806 [Mugilogobius chulae]|uniref:WW domain binding protein 1 n=1 Tax=Mugilogobius chulae TaxID=88201 RepID=A0AAW0P7G9_9GOBI